MDLFKQGKRAWLQIVSEMKAAGKVSNNNLLFRNLYSQLSGTTIARADSPEEYIENGYNQNSTVFAIVKYIYSKAAGVPLVIQKMNSEGVYEDIGGHEILEYFARPNEYQGQHALLSQLYGDKLLTGNGFLYFPTIKDGQHKGQFTEIFNAPAHKMELVSGTWIEPIKGFKLEGAFGGEIMPKESFLHIKYPNFYSDKGREFIGTSPLEAAYLTLKRSNENYKNSYNALKSGTAKAFVKEKNVRRSKEQKDAIQRELESQVNEAHNYNNLIYTDADMEVIKIGNEIKDLGLMADAIGSLRDLCNVYSVQSQLFNDPDNKTYNNMKEARKAAYTDAIIPLVEGFCRDFTRCMMYRKEGAESVPIYEEGLRLWYDTSEIEELQTDRKELTEWVKNTTGVASLNEQRSFLGLPDDDQGDVILIGRATVPLDLIDQTFNQPLLSQNQNPFAEITDYPSEASSLAKQAIDSKNGHNLGNELLWSRAAMISKGLPLNLETAKALKRILKAVKDSPDPIIFQAAGGQVMLDFLNERV